MHEVAFAKRRRFFKGESGVESDVDCVRNKLAAAKCLREARVLGLDRESVLLRDYDDNGGAQYVAKSLVRLLSAASSSHEERLQTFSAHFTPFCEQFGISADTAKFECTVDLCRGKSVSSRAIEESCSIARGCSSVIVRCDIALAVLRAALLCDSALSDVLKLAKESIAWASCDSGRQSELEEAARLLKIDNIVLTYCGSGARELFRVENPRHAIRLLGFVTKHVNRETVIDDALSLCEAFHQLSSFDAVTTILQNAILHDNCELSLNLLKKLIAKNSQLAAKGLVGSVLFSQGILEECSKAQTSGCDFERLEQFRNRATHVCVVCGELIFCAIENDLIIPQNIQAEIDCYVQNVSLKTLRDAFLRVERLQRENGIYISLRELQETKVALDRTTQFLEEVAACYTSGDLQSLNKKLTEARRACSLLADGSRADERELWIAASALVTIAFLSDFRDGKILDFMSVIGLLTTENTEVDLSGRAHVAIALSLCVGAAKRMHGQQTLATMKMVVEATAIVRDYSLVSTNDNMFASAVSLAGHLDVSTHVFARVDEGAGECIESFRLALQSQAWTRSFSSYANTRSENGAASSIAVPRLTLHPSWYIGDGLLLPPGDSLSKCLLFCRGLLSVGNSSDDGSMALSDLVAGRGAHSLALRVVCMTGAIQASCVKPCEGKSAFQDLRCLFDETTTALAERSLGGTGSGITSSVIDSQQAVVFLLALPVKQAFAAYKSCILTARKTQNFDRLNTLASVGIVAGSGESKFVSESAIFSVGWKKQSKFLMQCRQLSAKATWWAILKDLGVDFDSQLLLDAEVDTSDGVGDTPGRESEYAASLIPALIGKLSQSRSASDVLRLTALYAKTFFLPRDLVVSRYVEFLLTTSARKRTFDASKCEKAVRASLQLLFPPLKRASVLRRCLVELEKTESAGQNYELLNLVLGLYQETLANVLDRETQTGQLDLSRFEAELELIDRRKDTLAIISSFFVGDRLAERPSFSKFFQPLRVPFNHAANESEQPRYSILGHEPSNTDDMFDPLRPLEKVFLTSLNTSAVTALAPLCRPLGLPQGYIHARSLKARFHHSSKNNVAQPSFENDVNPVLKRIRSHREKAILAEWCAGQYKANDTEKLKCYEIVLQSSMRASTDIEQKRHQFPNDKTLEQEELLALAKVKKMSSKQDALSDSLRAKAILLSANGQSKGAVKAISNALAEKLDLKCRDASEGLSPESLIDFLYVNGSLLASEACLENESCLSIAHFRQFCTVVHSACQSIADQHSHIDHGYRARRHAHRWLFFGDEWGTELCPDAEPATVAVLPPSSTHLVDIDEEDTKEFFVMDMSSIQVANDGDWSAAKGNGFVQNVSNTRCQEESSVLRDDSLRELSEKVATRSALRIAFVMAFSVDQRLMSDESSVKENSDSNKKSVNRSRPLSIFQTKADSGKVAVHNLCLELLQIVFAKSGTSASVLFSQWGSFDADTSKREVPKTITFAMRHRALRAASVLCPQEVLEQVASDENFLHSNNGDKCTLLLSTFGVFLAKEIEEMGLPLPHSDLVQLSSMNFASYARTLWRYHRDDDVLNRSKGKGRLLLLLIEMACKSDNIDSVFMEQLLDEMIRLNLSRGLLLALEHVVLFSSDSSVHRVLWNPLSKAITAIGRAVLLETQSILSQGIQNNVTENGLDCRIVAQTFERLYRVAASLCESNPQSGLEQLLNFAHRVSSTCGDMAPIHPLVADILRISQLACDRARTYSKLPTITVNPGAE